MRKFILPAFAVATVATVAILAGAAVAEGPGGPAASHPMHGRATILPTDSPTMLRGPYGGPSDAQIQAQVFGDLAAASAVRPTGAASPVQTLPRFPGAHGLHNRAVGR